ncbi:MAG: large subunit ribosomal protein [Solirubrobacteraceae bacterium]|jgi:large subunit ribosomal protein L21|nr:large subunit ribosomal protein [Solirubrobacteraceae bacterium]
MYAIVKTGGKQYRVERGQRLLVERLAAEAGSDIALEPILYRSDEAVFDKAGLESVQVTAKVLAHVRGEKLRVFKFKPKRGYKRRTGHRQDLTQIEVTEIAQGKAKAKPAKAAAAESGDKPTPKVAKAADRPAAKPADKAASAKAGAAKPAAAKRAAKPAAAKPAKAKAQSQKAKEEPSDGS